jgi:hypothetical protein
MTPPHTPGRQSVRSVCGDEVERGGLLNQDLFDSDTTVASSEYHTLLFLFSEF